MQIDEVEDDTILWECENLDTHQMLAKLKCVCDKVTFNKAAVLANVEGPSQEYATQ